MRKLMIMSVLAMVCVFFAVGTVSAVKPGKEVNPNGFPSGPHYNLNIIGKKTNFVCPEQEYYLEISGGDRDGELVESCPDGYVCDVTQEPIYGNVIFVPEDGDFEIYMQSGKGKKAEAIPELQVTDPCGRDGEATLQLPKCDDGYRVYARALGKPTGEPYYDMLSNPQLNVVQDDDGNDLIYLGELTDNGIVTADGDKFISRGKGKSKAIPITDLFMWTGYVCAFPGENETGTIDICWMDNPDPDMEDGLVNYGDVFAMPNYDLYPQTGCPTEYMLMTDVLLSCTYYETRTWMFNVAEFVECMWGLDNHGMKLLQIRFYPN
jgi:hypothetical protein